MSIRGGVDVEPSTLPSALRTGRGLLALLAAVHLLVPVGMWAGRDDLAAQITAAHPRFDALTVQESVRAALGAGLVFHLALTAIAGALALRMRRGRRTYRRILVVSQVLALVAGVVSWSSSPLFHLVVPVVTVAELLLLGLVTIPVAARRHFSGDAVVVR